MSVLSFPERGKWGNARYRGNCSGHVYAEIFRMLKPQTFCDPMVGGGTSIEVAREMGIEAVGLDLKDGFNILRQSVLEQLPKAWQLRGGADLVLEHPAYHNMILYSGNVWGEAHPDDLSRCVDYDDHLDKLAQAILNGRAATREGGHYGFILGDLRRRGEYMCIPSDIQAMLPRGERRAVLVKVQHNTTSEREDYGRLRYGRVTHETIVLYERRGTVYAAFAQVVGQANRRAVGNWKAAVRMAAARLGERFTLSELYGAVFEAAPEKVQGNEHWQAKVRQTLQKLPDFHNQERGVWGRAA